MGNIAGKVCYGSGFTKGLKNDQFKEVEEEKAVLTIPFFENLSTSKLKKLTHLFERRVFEKDEIIVEEEKQDGCFHVIINGMVQIYATAPDGSQQELRILCMGEWFGESALVGDLLCATTVIALETTTILSLSHEQFINFSDSSEFSVTVTSPHGNDDVQPISITLSKLPMFAEVQEDKLQQLASLFTFRRIKAETIICEQGDEADGFYIIVKGRVEITARSEGGEEIHLNTLANGAWFGEMALIEKTHRIATVRTVQDSVFLFLDRHGFEKFDKVAPEVRQSEVFNHIMRQRTANSLKAIPIFQLYRQKHIGPLQQFDEEKLAVLGELFQFVEFAEGTKICEQGEIGDAFYLIVQGAVSIISQNPEGEDVFLAELSENSWFGEISLLEETRRTATVVTRCRTVLLKLTADHFQRFMQLSPQLVETIQQMLGVRKSEVLETIPFFSGVKENKPWSKLGLLGGLFEFENGNEDSVVFHRNSIGDKFYLIVDGHVNVYSVNAAGEETQIDRLGPNQWFGEIALLCDTLRTATVRCAEHCQFLTLTTDKFKKFLAIAPELSESFTSLLYHRTANSLKTIELFSHIKENKPWSKLDLLGSLLRYESYDAHQVMFRINDEADKFYIIVSGRCECSATNDQANVTLDTLEQGTYFGEIALIENTRRTATITTLEPCIFLTLERAAFTKFLGVAPEVKPVIAEVLQRRHGNLNQFHIPPPEESKQTPVILGLQNIRPPVPVVKSPTASKPSQQPIVFQLDQQLEIDQQMLDQSEEDDDEVPLLESMQ